MTQVLSSISISDEKSILVLKRQVPHRKFKLQSRSRVQGKAKLPLKVKGRKWHSLLLLCPVKIYPAEVEKQEWNVNSSLFLQGGDIEQESERSRPGKMHLQNGTMPCADTALLTHRIPSYEQEAPCSSLERSVGHGRAGSSWPIITCDCMESVCNLIPELMLIFSTGKTRTSWNESRGGHKDAVSATETGWESLWCSAWSRGRLQWDLMTPFQYLKGIPNRGEQNFSRVCCNRTRVLN